jgi:hypothetical protein
MVIQNVIQTDTAVYQCNVSNIHGYIFANFFVNVICKSLNSFVKLVLLFFICISE